MRGKKLTLFDWFLPLTRSQKKKKVGIISLYMYFLKSIKISLFKLLACLNILLLPTLMILFFINIFECTSLVKNGSVLKNYLPFQGTIN